MPFDMRRAVVPASLAPGDVLVVRTGGRPARLIRFGAWIGGHPSKWNHVAVYIKYENGVHWGIAGQPGGVGWVDVGDFVADKVSISNAAQPRTAQQRADIVTIMTAMAVDHTRYDWPAIAIDVLNAVAPLWTIDERWGSTVPGHVVCSSAADYAYAKLGLPSPKPDKECTPWHWAEFDLNWAWQT